MEKQNSLLSLLFVHSIIMTDESMHITYVVHILMHTLLDGIIPRRATSSSLTTARKFHFDILRERGR